MFKRIILSFLLVTFLIPQHIIFANTNNVYYNETFKYIVSFPDNWYIFSEEMRNNLSPDERLNSPAIFIKEDGSSQMFIRHLNSNDKKFNLYKNVIEYVQKTPEDKQKIKRVLNPISTELGRSIDSYNIDELNETIELQLTQSSPQFGEIHTTVFWKEFKDVLIEFEFYHFEDEENLMLEASAIINSFTISPDALNSNIKEGSLDLLNNKTLSNLESDNNFMTKIVDVIEKPVVWGTALSIVFLIIIAKIIYKLA